MFVVRSSRIALAAGVRRFFLVVARGVHVLVVNLSEHAVAAALHVPHVADLAGVGGVLVAERLAFAYVTKDCAAVLVEAGD